MPVHGEHRMLVKHSETAQSVGVPKENIVIIDNGDSIDLTVDSIAKGEKVPSGIQLVDTAGVVHEHVMEERQQLAEDGVITIAAVIDSKGNLLVEPQVNLRGVVCTMEVPSLERLITRTVDRTISDRIKSNLLLSEGDNINWNSIRIEVETNLSRVIQREINSEPLVIFILQVQEGITNNNGQINNESLSDSDDNDEGDGKFTRRRRKATANV